MNQSNKSHKQRILDLIWSPENQFILLSTEVTTLFCSLNINEFPSYHPLLPCSPHPDYNFLAEIPLLHNLIIGFEGKTTQNHLISQKSPICWGIIKMFGYLNSHDMEIRPIIPSFQAELITSSNENQLFMGDKLFMGNTMAFLSSLPPTQQNKILTQAKKQSEILIEKQLQKLS